MNYLFLTNAFVYFVSAISIIVAISHIPKPFRWTRIIPVLCLLYIGTSYFIGFIEVGDIDYVGSLIRPMTGALPLSLAVNMWIFVKILKSWKGK